ncbi:transmembrane domain-containing protein [Cryptosporidium canis]|uniref:Transmembrane domain-containing protein n=1 Tax=Cryptosporidium canis TaxID=195482 RepID=A0ABQ8PA55_9CRYT|nr:transmembrane domain-containing protein [Cryptosporidium canis]
MHVNIAYQVTKYLILFMVFVLFPGKGITNQSHVCNPHPSFIRISSSLGDLDPNSPAHKEELNTNAQEMSNSDSHDTLGTIYHADNTTEHVNGTVEHVVDTVAHVNGTVEHVVDTAEHANGTVDHVADTVEHANIESDQVQSTTSLEEDIEDSNLVGIWDANSGIQSPFSESIFSISEDEQLQSSTLDGSEASVEQQGSEVGDQKKLERELDRLLRKEKRLSRELERTEFIAKIYSKEFLSGSSMKNTIKYIRRYELIKKSYEENRLLIEGKKMALEKCKQGAI